MSQAKTDFAWEDISERQFRFVTLKITEWTYKVGSSSNSL